MSSIRVEQISGRVCDVTERVCSSIDNSICSLLDDSNFQWHFLHSPIHSSFQFCCLFTSFIDSDSSCQLLQLKVQHSEKIAFQNQTVTSEGLIRTDWLLAVQFKFASDQLEKKFAIANFLFYCESVRIELVCWRINNEGTQKTWYEKNRCYITFALKYVWYRLKHQSCVSTTWWRFRPSRKDKPICEIDAQRLDIIFSLLLLGRRHLSSEARAR